MALVIAKETVHVAGKDGMRTIRAGQAVQDSDPAVKALPELFATPDELAATADDVRFTAEVEAATAAPGEARTTRLPRRK